MKREEVAMLTLKIVAIGTLMTACVVEIDATTIPENQVVFADPAYMNFCNSTNLEETLASDGPISGNAKCSLMYQAGITTHDEQYYADQIITKESTWTMWAENDETGSYGYCQANPNWHELSDTYKTNAIEQLQWCDNYAMERYGSWEEAYYFWIDNHWW